MKGEARVQTRSTRDLAKNIIIADFGAWTNSYNRALTIWSQSSAGMFKIAAEVSQEIMTFSQNRLQTGIDAWQAISTCRSPRELIERHSQIVRETATDCFDIAEKFLSRGISLVLEAGTTFEEQNGAKP